MHSLKKILKKKKLKNPFTAILSGLQLEIIQEVGNFLVAFQPGQFFHRLLLDRDGLPPALGDVGCGCRPHTHTALRVSLFVQQLEVAAVHPVPGVQEAAGPGAVGAVVEDLVDLEVAAVLQQVADDAGDVLGVVQAAVGPALELQPQAEQHVVEVEALAVVEVAVGLAQVDPAPAPLGQGQPADLALLAEEALDVPGSGQAKRDGSMTHTLGDGSVKSLGMNEKELRKRATSGRQKTKTRNTQRFDFDNKMSSSGT